MYVCVCVCVYVCVCVCVCVCVDGRHLLAPPAVYPSELSSLQCLVENKAACSTHPIVFLL